MKRSFLIFIGALAMIALLSGWSAPTPQLIQAPEPKAAVAQTQPVEIEYWQYFYESKKNLVDQLIQINSEDLDVKKFTVRQRIASLRQWCYYTCGTMAGTLRAYTAATSHV